MQLKNKILAIVGPTAVGKTGLVIELAQRLNGEIIGLDSRQIYMGMAIGTAQPTLMDQASVPHHLIAFRSPDQKITAGEYAELVSAVVEDLTQHSQTPILCGGAGLYFRAINHGIFSGSDSDEGVRERLDLEYSESPDLLYNRLKKIDPEYAEKVHINNRKRLIRALEIFEITGVAPSVHFKKQPEQKYQFNLFTVLVTRPLADLEKRIRNRTNQMLEGGWIAETRRLMQYREAGEFHAMDSIGYREIMDHLDGKLSHEEMVELIVLRTRQYAKRQLTWFKKEPLDLTINLSDNSNLSDNIDKIIACYKNDQL